MGFVARMGLGRAGIITLLLLPLIVAVSYSLATQTLDVPTEWDFFAPAGASFLTGDWAGVFDDVGLQAGLLEILPYGIALQLGLSGTLAWTVLYSFLAAVMIFGLVAAIFTTAGDHRGRFITYIALAAAVVAIVGGSIPYAISVSHPSQVMIPLLWAIAAQCAREGYFVACGALIGVSAGWETWGVLGAPVIFLAARPGFVRAALGGIAALVILYVPFAVFGTFHMFEMSWDVSGKGVVGLLFPDLETFPWSLRLLQAVLALAAGCGMALLARGYARGTWLVPFAVLAARDLFDPLQYGYYLIAATTMGIGLLAVIVYTRDWKLVAVAALYVAWTASSLSSLYIGHLVLVVFVGVMAAWLIVERRRARTSLVGQAHT